MLPILFFVFFVVGCFVFVIVIDLPPRKKRSGLSEETSIAMQGRFAGFHGAVCATRGHQLEIASVWSTDGQSIYISFAEGNSGDVVILSIPEEGRRKKLTEIDGQEFRQSPSTTKIAQRKPDHYAVCRRCLHVLFES